MGLDVVTVGYGRPAADALRARVAATKAADPLAPVTVVVPTNYVGVSMRRHLADGGRGIAAVTFLTLYRLAELLGSPRLAAAGRRPVSTPVLGAAVRAVLGERPGMFAAVAAHPATEQALVDAHRLLTDCDGPALDALASQGRRANEVVRIHRAVRQRVAADWYDEHDLLVAAVEAVGAGAPLTHLLGAVVLHLPQDVSQASGRLVRALAERVPVTVIAGITGDERADAAVARSVARLGGELPSGSAEPPPAAEAVISVSDADEEVRAMVRRLVAAVREGVPLDRIAVLYASKDPYARLVHQQLEAAGIPRNGAAVRTIGEGLLGRSLRSLLALPDRRFRRQEVLALLAHAPVRDGDGRRVPAAAWERVSRAAGVVGGVGEWDARLARYATEQLAEAVEAERDGLDGRAAAKRRDADHADGLRTWVGGLVAELDEATVPATWAGKVEWAHRLIRTRLGGERARVRWPEHEVRAAQQVEAALDRLAGLDAVDGQPPTLDVFRRTLDLELDSALDRVGRFGEGVLVGHVGLAVGLILDRVYVLGLAEGAFPARRLDDSLLPDREREVTGGQLALRADRTDDEHRQLLAAVAAADGRAVLGFPRGDLRRTGERVPSRWLLDTVAALDGTDRAATVDLVSAHGKPWFDEVPSFAAGIGATAFPATEQDHRLASLLAGTAVDDHILRLGVELVTARRSRSFTRFDGNLSHLDLPSPADGVAPVSATRLETWTACPHAYLMRYLLHVDEVESPERLLDLSALDLGTIVHDSLDRFLREVLDRPDGDRPGPADRWTDDDRDRLRTIADEVCDGFEARGLTGKPVFWRRTRARILRGLDVLLTKDDDRRAGAGCTPVASELGFSALDVTLSDGRVVRFRGSADRVDRRSDGGLVVIDYKTGSDFSFKGLDEANPDHDGTKLQLPVYALAARAAHGSAGTPVEAAYWFVTEKRKWAWVGYEVTDSVLARYDEVLRTIVDGIAGGVFVPHPEAPKSFRAYVQCAYCDPDGIGTADRRREWERTREAPELAAYRALVEPEPEEEPVLV